ncbi:hypothetical protein [Candidiatus Paracoxiella cheracis]|uniref:hypothetical protein n=1 Tax=Candidiatus Paracoxiella cheracis TaxID=3405120 RepID=UPI003BF556A9
MPPTFNIKNPRNQDDSSGIVIHVTEDPTALPEPPENTSPPSTTSQQNNSSWFARLFGRRKSSTAKESALTNPPITNPMTPNPASSSKGGCNTTINTIIKFYKKFIDQKISDIERQLSTDTPTKRENLIAKKNKLGEAKKQFRISGDDNEVTLKFSSPEEGREFLEKLASEYPAMKFYAYTIKPTGEKVEYHSKGDGTGTLHQGSYSENSTPINEDLTQNTPQIPLERSETNTAGSLFSRSSYRSNKSNRPVSQASLISQMSSSCNSTDDEADKGTGNFNGYTRLNS